MRQSPSSTTSSAIRQRRPQLRATVVSLAQAATPARCYCVAIGLFLLIRGGSTLAEGARYGLPGDGWRAIVQIVLAVLLLAATRHRVSARNAVIAVGVIYAAQTLLGIHMHDLLGIIPVDGRDHIVHPAIAILALMAVVATRRGRVGPQPQPPATD